MALDLRLPDVVEPPPAPRPPFHPDRQQAAHIPKPQRLRTAYSYFVKDNYARTRMELKTRTPQPIIKRIGERWHALTENEMRMYGYREEGDRVRYQEAKVEWARQHAGRPMSYLNRKRREIDDPKRPQSAYLLSRAEMQTKLRSESPDMVAKERDREIVRLWRALDSEAREKYKRKAEADKVRFLKDLQVFQSGQRANVIDRARQRVEQLQAEQLRQQQAEPNRAIVQVI